MLRLFTLFLCACTADRVEVSTYIYDARHGAGELDVHTLPDVSGAPAVVYIHGGGWRSGQRENDAATADRLARTGYVVVNIDYRLVPDGVFPLAVQDAFCALAFVRAHATDLGVDPDRIAVMGHSAGAHLAALVGVASDITELQDDGCPWGRTGPPIAVVSVAGPMDLRDLHDDVVADFVGVAYDTDPDRYATASPITHVDAAEPPFLLVHSEHDLVVDVSQSEAMAATLRDAGNQARLLRLEGGGHILGDGPGLGLEELELATDTPEAWMALIDFLSRVGNAP